MEYSQVKQEQPLQGELTLKDYKSNSAEDLSYFEQLAVNQLTPSLHLLVIVYKLFAIVFVLLAQ